MIKRWLYGLALAAALRGPLTAGAAETVPAPLFSEGFDDAALAQRSLLAHAQKLWIDELAVGTKRIGPLPEPAPRAALVRPAHDPLDIPFRRAPMALASRSIVVPLATNLHLAFDAELVHAHTAWEGAPLNLYGPPFNGTATRFICDFTGTALWTHLPVPSWEVAEGAGYKPANTDFLGVSTGADETTFHFEVETGTGPTGAARIRETPRAEPVLSRRALVRRLEIGPLPGPVRWSPFHGTGLSVPVVGSEGAVVIRREQDLLLLVARGLATNVLVSSLDDLPRVIVTHSERDGKGPYSVTVTNAVPGPLTRITLTVSPAGTEQVVEIATMLCANEAEAAALAKTFATQSVNRALPLNTSKPAVQPPPVILANPEFLDKPAGDAWFTVEHFSVPKDIKLLVGGMDFLPNGDLVVCTYAGEVWIIEGATGAAGQMRWRRFARGLNEPGGLRIVKGSIYVTQKCELTRLVDMDANGECDFFERVSDDWGYTGNYHSYATGPALDEQGNFYVMITGHRPIHEVPFMGWCLKISPPRDSRAPGAGERVGARHRSEGFCSGLRVPNGFGEFRGDIFATDNEGHWVSANKLNHLQAGKAYGYPSALPAPLAQFRGQSAFTPPAVWFPYAWMRSASGITTIADERFGPFPGQLLVGEFQNASVFRVALEKVNGQWQGAVFPFVKGFGSGVNRLALGPDGNLYVGGLRMGHWTSIAPQPSSLDRVRFTGVIPFEIREARAQADGFELTFTEPVDPDSAGDAENWDATQYTYGYDGQHNVPEKDRDQKIPGPVVQVTKATVAGDRRSVRLQMEGCRPRHVVQVRALGIKNAAGQKLRNDTFHYTLNQIPP